MIPPISTLPEPIAKAEKELSELKEREYIKGGFYAHEEARLEATISALKSAQACVAQELGELVEHLKSSKQTDSYGDEVLELHSTFKNLDEFKHQLGIQPTAREAQHG
jgi:hypothetical protein